MLDSRDVRQSLRAVRWPRETATRRLNFAQAFNPVGTNIGVFLAATLILPKLDQPVNLANVTPAQETGRAPASWALYRSVSSVSGSSSSRSGW